MRRSSASALRSPLAIVLLLQLLVAVSVSAAGNASAGSNATQHEDANKTATHLLDQASEVKVGPGLVAAVAIGVGLVICLAGYRLFRPTIFACGFVVGGVFLAGVAEAMFKNQTWMATASWIAFVIGGLALGSLVLFLYNAGIFLGGAAAGVMLAFTLNTSLGPKLYPDNPNVVLVVMAFRTKDKDDSGHWVYTIPAAWWGYVGGALALFVLGMVVQFKKTAHGQDHTKHRAQKGAMQQGQSGVSAV
ncbi:hypothetical protein PybrP1_012813 [[Pythium] brassicae (nom. inval.)]|nr:hypothetical protein PybrP1_012813 [[Pythium] brassicae (nom. inval.)]